GVWRRLAGGSRAAAGPRPRPGAPPPGSRLLVVGHSCGGQLLGLAPTSERVDAAIFVTAGIPYWRHWPRPHRWAVWALWRLLLPALCAGGRDTVPARRLGLSGVDVPCGVALEWARWGRSERYLFDPEHGLDVSRYSSLELPIRSYAFADDLYSPPSTVAALLDEYGGAEVELRRVAPEDAGMERIGHFGFFRERSRGFLWREAAGWLAAGGPIPGPRRAPS
ncbi:MAG: hypothetical protein R3199_03070, partial [Gemmatimonadota bacterium]|nr:hypothetical protein [Gemmatimonadota bacterium]